MQDSLVVGIQKAIAAKLGSNNWQKRLVHKKY